jgi:hypothetical protein
MTEVATRSLRDSGKSGRKTVAGLLRSSDKSDKSGKSGKSDRAAGSQI